MHQISNHPPPLSYRSYYLGLPFFCTWAGIFLMMWGMLVSTRPVYGNALVSFLTIVAIPCCFVVVCVFMFFMKNSLTVSIDSLINNHAAEFSKAVD
jgi:hypothetical protein